MAGIIRRTLIRARMYDSAIKQWTDNFLSPPDPATGQRSVSPAMGRALMRGRSRERPFDVAGLQTSCSTLY